MSKLIVMLTYNDETVENARKVFASCRDLPVEFWGFKNIGLPLDQMKALVDDMKAAGKITFLEVVTLSEPECLDGARMATACGFDFLLGTVFYPSVANYCVDNKLKYLPFCGKVHGHPSILEGTVQEIVEDAQRLKLAGCQGVDILAYRHKKCPEEIIKALVEKVDFPIIVAGSIGSFERIDIVESLDPWAFTIGSALFTYGFCHERNFRSQLEAVITHMAVKNT